MSSSDKKQTGILFAVAQSIYYRSTMIPTAKFGGQPWEDKLFETTMVHQRAGFYEKMDFRLEYLIS